MLLKRQGFPEEDELVMCTVTNVQHHSVFCNLDEYGKSGMIHISEVSPGRIRNLRDYVVEGKKVVCKVLRIHRDRGHIDLSLRRVNESQRRNKINDIKQEQKAEKILEFVAKKLNKDPKSTFERIKDKVLEHYPNLYVCFQDIVTGNIPISFLDLEKPFLKDLEDTIKQRIKIPEVEIGGFFTIRSYAPDGIEVIKRALKKASGENILINYLGAGKYGLDVTAPDYKQAEKRLKKVTDTVTKEVEKHKGEVSFERQDKR
ncbi:translation initiation factor IF-2 subunit alpha [Candidatus Woesearchaeota archaeon]|nr:translation initiation factor IF-2 subunit alpha [Candidatus Woesearchaeota archaeon]